MATDSAVATRLKEPRLPGYWADLVLGRTVPALFFGLFIVFKLYSTYLAVRGGPSHWLDIVNQGLGSVYFIMLTVLYVVRLPRRSGNRQAPVVLVAFFGAFAIFLAGELPTVAPRGYLLGLADTLEVAGIIYSVWSLAYLRRSFSILPEARRLVTGGPYSVSRHPLYLGEAAASLGVTIPTIGPAGILLLALNFGCQFLRIKWEERVLAGEFPGEYRAYQRAVPQYLPDPARLLSRLRGR